MSRRIELAGSTRRESGRCEVEGCTEPVEVRYGGRLCSDHRTHRARHGSASKSSYTGLELRPYLRAAKGHVRKHLEDEQIRHALERLRFLILGEPVKSPGRLRRQKSLEKVAPLLLGLRRARVRPDEILAIILGVFAAAEEDSGKAREPDYPYVQVAKVVRRKKGVSGQPAASDSRGLPLLLFGRLLVRASSHAIQAHFAKVLSLKIRRSGRSATGRFAARLPVVPPLSKS